jgi:hypothetical protein
MAQAVSLRPSSAEARVRFRVSTRGVCGGQSGTAIDIPLLFRSTLSITFHLCSITRKRTTRTRTTTITTTTTTTTTTTIIIIIIRSHEKP